MAASAVIESFPDLFRDRYDAHAISLFYKVRNYIDLILSDGAVLLVLIRITYAYADGKRPQTCGFGPYFMCIPCSDFFLDKWLFCASRNLQAFGVS